MCAPKHEEGYRKSVLKGSGRFPGERVSKSQTKERQVARE